VTTTFPFTSPNNLPEITFIAGSNQELEFYVYTSGCAALDISGATITWGLAQFGNPTAILTKSGIISASPVNKFTVYLTHADTATLAAKKYIQQYEILDTSGSTANPSQGLVNITRTIF